MTTIITDGPIMPSEKYEQAKRAIQEMTLIDGFLFDSSIENEDDAKIVIGNMLKAFFDRDFKNIEITSQKQFQAIDTKYHGIRLDAFISEDPKDHSLSAKIIDIEMENRESDKPYLPRRLRYYSALPDAKSLGAGMKYDKIPDFISITISSYDPFGAGDMYYEARTRLTTHTDISYEDGITRMFFYTKGKPNFDAMSTFVKSAEHRRKLQEMLYYIQTGSRPATENADINDIDDVVTRVKMREEVTTEYMRQCDKEHIIRRETAEQTALETKRDDALEMIRFDRKFHIPAETTRERLKTILPSDDEINNLFAQIEEEEKALV
jgi:hypothetical protein